MITSREYLTMSDISINSSELEDIFNGAYSDMTGASTPPTESRILSNYISYKYSGNWVVWKDTEYNCNNQPIVIDNTNQINEFKKRLGFIFTSTFDRYHRLLTLYKDNENKLLSKLQSTTTNKFNDTPQNANVGETDNYTSTYSTTDTSIDSADLMTRIDNIERNYSNLYKDWVKEFKRLFGESVINN